MESVDRCRLTVCDSVCWESPSGDPLSVGKPFQMWISGDEQPYYRRMNVGEQWQTVETSWLNQVSMILIYNAAPDYLVNPSEEERRIAESRVLQFRADSSMPWIIPPGQSFRGCPERMPKLMELRCRNGTTKASVYLFPGER